MPHIWGGLVEAGTNRQRLLMSDFDQAGWSEMKDRAQEYRTLAADCPRQAATTDDANVHAQYTALAQMWSDLGDESEKTRAAFAQAQEVTATAGATN